MTDCIGFNWHSKITHILKGQNLPCI